MSRSPSPRAYGYWQLLFAVAAVSVAAPLIRLSDSGPLTVAFWRVALASAAAWLALLVRPQPRPRAANPGWVLVAGLFLGLHFWVWNASLDLTSVANSALLVTTQPIWAAIASSIILKDRVPMMGWLGILLALGGSALTIGFAGGSLKGDLMALAGGVLAAAYMVVGRHQRQTWSTIPYLARVYGAAAVTLAVGVVVTGDSFLPANRTDWWLFLALAAIPTGLGHTLYNWLLKHLPAYVVATSITGEPLGATLLAFWWLGEAPPLRTVLCAPLILAGIVVATLGLRGRAGAEFNV